MLHLCGVEVGLFGGSGLFCVKATNSLGYSPTPPKLLGLDPGPVLLGPFGGFWKFGAPHHHPSPPLVPASSFPSSDFGKLPAT